MENFPRTLRVLSTRQPHAPNTDSSTSIPSSISSWRSSTTTNSSPDPNTRTTPPILRSNQSHDHIQVTSLNSNLYLVSVRFPQLGFHATLWDTFPIRNPHDANHPGDIQLPVLFSTRKQTDMLEMPYDEFLRALRAETGEFWEAPKITANSDAEHDTDKDPSALEERVGKLCCGPMTIRNSYNHGIMQEGAVHTSNDTVRHFFEDHRRDWIRDHPNAPELREFRVSLVATFELPDDQEPPSEGERVHSNRSSSSETHGGASQSKYVEESMDQAHSQEDITTDTTKDHEPCNESNQPQTEVVKEWMADLRKMKKTVSNGELGLKVKISRGGLPSETDEEVSAPDPQDMTRSLPNLANNIRHNALASGSSDKHYQNPSTPERAPRIIAIAPVRHQPSDGHQPQADINDLVPYIYITAATPGSTPTIAAATARHSIVRHEPSPIIVEESHEMDSESERSPRFSPSAPELLMIRNTASSEAELVSRLLRSAPDLPIRLERVEDKMDQDQARVVKKKSSFFTKLKKRASRGFFNKNGDERL